MVFSEGHKLRKRYIKAVSFSLVTSSLTSSIENSTIGRPRVHSKHSLTLGHGGTFGRKELLTKSSSETDRGFPPKSFSLKDGGDRRGGGKGGDSSPPLLIASMKKNRLWCSFTAHTSFKRWKKSEYLS